MTTLSDGNLAHTFPAGWSATKYDDWAFYRNRFGNCCGGNKAVDFLAHNHQDRTLWLVELKDYRRFPRTKDDTLSLWDEVALKARDTLAGLFAAKVDMTHAEQSYAALALGARKLCVVLHLEQPRANSRLFRRAYELADIQQKLKQVLRPIDYHPRVIELSSMSSVPWTATSTP